MHAIAIRLEVARMLKAGDIYEDIVKKTGASTATISRIKRCLMYGSGGYSKILDRMAGKNPDILKIEGRKNKER
jgi:TrpR-related protein YerC/YecD